MNVRLASIAAAMWASHFALRPSPSVAQDTTAIRVTAGDSVTVRFTEADLRGVLQALGRHLDRPLLLAGLPAARVTLETPRPVPRAAVLALVRGLVESQNLELVRDSSYYRVRPREPAPAPAPAPSAPSAAAPLELTVVRLRHARAVDVAATLNALFGGSANDPGGGRRGTLSEELRRNVVPPAGPAGPPAGAAGTPALGGRSAVLEAAVTIVPDFVTNALLIRATARDAEVLARAVQALDLRPLQVLIEVVIVEARRDRQQAWGLDLFVPDQPIGRGNATAGGTQQGGGLGDVVIRLMDLGRADIDAVLRAGASSGHVKILSRPVLLAANNQEARILVGSQRPFVQVSRSLPTDAPSRDQVIQYKDVGTRLAVRPTISADGYVTLEVTQEVSSATTETAFDAPVISTREASTQVLVRDSQTIVLGGLIDTQRDVTSGGVPLLSELPIIGGLFGRQSRRTSETELFLFLTPRVLRTDQEVEDATRRFNTGAEEARPR